MRSVLLNPSNFDITEVHATAVPSIWRGADSRFRGHELTAPQLTKPSSLHWDSEMHGHNQESDNGSDSYLDCDQKLLLEM